MWTTLLTVYRNDAILAGADGRLAQHIPNCQVDEQDGKTIFMNGQAFTAFEIGIDFIVNVPYLANSLIQQNDVLHDELFTDPDSATRYQYRVAKRPKTYPGDRQTLFCKVVTGN